MDRKKKSCLDFTEELMRQHIETSRSWWALWLRLKNDKTQGHESLFWALYSINQQYWLDTISAVQKEGANYNKALRCMAKAQVSTDLCDKLWHQYNEAVAMGDIVPRVGMWEKRALVLLRQWKKSKP